jgi:zinc/manganese transport system substrate-binding protein
MTGTLVSSPRLTLTIALTAGAAVLTACGSGSTGSSKAPDGPVRVVASTNVYGDIATSIGGSDVRVTSILSDPAQDPHSFEANPRTALAVAKADLLIENGGGYDDYMERLQASGKGDADVLDVVDLSGKKAPEGGELNEHMWYDLPTVKLLARDLASRLGKLDPAHKKDFTGRAERFTGQIDMLIDREAALRATGKGTPIGITEPVPIYMTEACGLVNKTPEDFSEAIEEGDDISAPVLDETLDQYRLKKVQALFYNVQTSGPITEKVKSAAQDADIPVVAVTETLPPGQDYLAWMGANLDALDQAISG